MPVEEPRKSSTSWICRFIIRSSIGSRDAGFSAGASMAWRALCRRISAAGFGRAASIRSRMVCSSPWILARASWLPGWNSTTRRYATSAKSSWSRFSNSRAFSKCPCAAESRARSRAIL